MTMVIVRFLRRPLELQGGSRIVVSKVLVLQGVSGVSSVRKDLSSGSCDLSLSGLEQSPLISPLSEF